jgi:hypothetical protein
MREKRQVYTGWSSIDEMVKSVSREIDGLEDVYIDLEKEYDYGDDWTRLYVTGWRDATEKEIEQHQREQHEAESRTRQFEEAQILRLRRARPELFK